MIRKRSVANMRKLIEFNDNLSGVRNLFVNGIDSLQGSTITTQLTINDEKVKIYIDGTNDYAYDVICSNGDKCFINCLSNTSCTNMILFCDGVCYLNYGNYSPSSISGTWYSLTPTTNPTMIPTQYPIIQSTKTPHMHGKSTESPMWTTSTIELTSKSDNNNGGVSGISDSDNETLILVIVVYYF